ncbi:M13 family metallopeptidase [Lactobacillus mulieris]|uniref:M13 family metallopeptidase n=1 Tax=Lactobacillus mulieris TaxID=2508708 RepID=UPI001F1AE4A5|nr:M13 family metallopeptidase [Lactobacillus mulieris]MCF1783419.1 M13 family metallopeptidase [Lactobacillus mulieris]
MKNILQVRGGAGDLTKADVNASPKDNLYLSVNSAWQKDAVIPADRTEIGVNTEIDMRIEKRMKDDLAALIAGKEDVNSVPNLAKAVDFYKLALNIDQRNVEKTAPIQADLHELLALKDFSDFNTLAASNLNQILNSAVILPFAFEVDADMKNTQKHALYFAGPGTFLPDTSSYQAPDAEKLLQILAEQTEHLLELANVSKDEAKSLVEKGLAFDKRLAQVVKSSEEWADYPACYNPVSLDDFLNKFNSFDVKTYLEHLLEKLPDRVIVMEPRYLDKVDALFNPDNFDQIKGWMVIKFINNSARLLSQKMREAAFPFSQSISGMAELPSIQRQAYYLTNGFFDEVLGVFYGQKYLGQAAKADITQMIKQMIKVYESRIANNTWLSKSTKEKAIIKLNALVLKIGYPEKLEPIYDQLRVDSKLSLYENQKDCAVVRVKYNLSKLFKPVNRNVWLMPGNMNNACYDPQRNDITFPAGILQAPFYDLKQSRAANYGGIGATIAHEISHAFDNNGAQFDENGNLSNWWTKQDFDEFEKRTQAAVDLYDGVQYGPSKLNGKQIVAENIADLGGLTCAIQANKHENGDMSDLFENYARSWAQIQRPAAIKTEVSVDVHAPQPTRVNIPVQCQKEFYETYQVSSTDGMWLDPEKRVEIW